MMTILSLLLLYNANLFLSPGVQQYYTPIIVSTITRLTWGSTVSGLPGLPYQQASKKKKKEDVQARKYNIIYTIKNR